MTQEKEGVSMNCPYCFGEIEDQAIVCKFCTRDLHFFLPINSRLEKSNSEIRNLEQRVAILEESVRSYRESTYIAVDRRNFLLGCVTIALSIALFLVRDVVFYKVSVQYGGPDASWYLGYLLIGLGAATFGFLQKNRKSLSTLTYSIASSIVHLAVFDLLIYPAQNKPVDPASSLLLFAVFLTSISFYAFSASLVSRPLNRYFRYLVAGRFTSSDTHDAKPEEKIPFRIRDYLPSILSFLATVVAAIINAVLKKG